MNWSGTSLNSERDMNKEMNNEEIYSKDVEEILSRKPSWVVRYGILLLSLGFLLFLFTSYYISYPEKTTFLATQEMEFLPESINKEIAYFSMPYHTEFSEIFKTGKFLTVFSSIKTAKTYQIEAQVTGIINDPKSGELMVVLRITRAEQELIFENNRSAEVKIITKETNLLSRIFSPILKLFKDPLSQMEKNKS